MALAKERGATDDPVIRQRLARCHTQGRDHALPRAAVAHPVPPRPPARSGVAASSRSSGASTTRRSPSWPSTSSAPTPWPRRGRWPTSSFQTDSPGAPERQRQLGRHVRTTPAPARSTPGRARSSATSSGELVLGLPEGATRRRPRVLARAAGGPILTPRLGAGARCAAVLPAPVAVAAPALRQVAPARAARAGGGGRRSSRCRRPTTSGSGWRPPTAAPATRRRSRDDLVTYLRWCRNWP